MLQALQEALMKESSHGEELVSVLLARTVSYADEADQLMSAVANEAQENAVNNLNRFLNIYIYIVGVNDCLSQPIG